MKTRWIIFFLLLILATASCSSAPLETGASSVLPASEAEISPSEESPEAILPILPTQGVSTQMFQSIPDPLTADLQNLINAAKENLAGRLSSSIDQVNFIGVYDVTWPDSSLGCPQDGMMYTQVLTPGYLIQLEHGSIQYEYHSGKSTRVVYCENPVQPLPGIPDSY